MYVAGGSYSRCSRHCQGIDSWEVPWRYWSAIKVEQNIIMINNNKEGLQSILRVQGAQLPSFVKHIAIIISDSNPSLIEHTSKLFMPGNYYQLVSLFE